MEHKNKIALVTGGSRGIGKAICLDLAARGFSVTFTYIRSGQEAEVVLGQMNALSDLGHAAYKCDMSSWEEVQALFKVLKEHDRLPEVLVNNAGITGDKKLFLMTSQEDWWRVFEHNVNNILHTTRLTLPGMVRKKEGVIINISSLSAKKGTPGSSAYAASKAALIAFTKSLFKEVGGYGIKFFTVSPGMVMTDMVMGASPDFFKDRLINSPLKRLGEASEVANLVGYLASDAPLFLGGQEIGIDGLQ